MLLQERLSRWKRNLFERSRVEQELDEELQTYVDLLAAEKSRGGMSAEDARRAAMIQAGGIEQIKEGCREARSFHWLDTLNQDIRYGLRMLLRSPGFTIVAVLTLALGIGANTAIFSVIHAVLLQPLPYKDSDRLVHLVAADPNDPRSGTSYRSFELWKSQSRTFEDMAVYYRNTGWSRVTVRGIGDAESVQAGFTSANLFPLLGVQASVGRVFSDDEEQRQERVAVISDALWKRQFGSAPGVIGRPLQVDGTVFTIIGIMPPVFQFPARETQLWLPVTTNRLWVERPARDDVHSRGFYMRWNVVARLRAEVPIDTAQAEMSAIVARLDQDDPDLNMGLGLA